MGLKTLYVLAGLTVLAYVVATVWLIAGKATTEQAISIIALPSVALYTYLRAEPKTPDGGTNG